MGQVIDIVNETVVMDYIDTPAGAVSYQGRGAAWLLVLASLGETTMFIDNNNCCEGLKSPTRALRRE